MDSKTWILLKTLMKSTSGINTLKFSKDKGKRKRIIGNYVGVSVLYMCLIVYCVFLSINYGKLNLSKAIPAGFYIVVLAITFLFTLMKCNGYLFGYKGYDMQISMPLSIKEIVASRFIYMYIKSIAGVFLASISMLIGYGIYVKPAFYIYFIWIIMTLAAPIIPMVIATLIGALIARIGSGFRSKNIIQTIFIFIFIFASFLLQFYLQNIENKSEIDQAMVKTSEAFLKTEHAFLPMAWFDRAILYGEASSFLLFIGVSIFVFVFYYNIMVKSYIKINTKLNTYQKSMKKDVFFKQKSIEKTIAYKELKRMLGSSLYLTNVCFGHLLMTIASIVVLFVDGSKVIEVVMKGAPIKPEIMLPAIPFIVYFFIGMVSTCCCTPSLEGKNYWIMQSLPITKMQMARGKMLFNLYLNIPFGIIGVICFGICFKVDISYMLIYILCIVVLIIFSTFYGMVCGLKHIKLEWENEVEVIKQGAAVVLYLFPNMVVTMAIVIGSIFLSFIVDGRIVLLGLTIIYAGLAFLSYKRIVKICSK